MKRFSNIALAVDFVDMGLHRVLTDKQFADDLAKGGTDTVNIGWWNSFVLDGITMLSRIFDEKNMNPLIEHKEPYKGWPLMMDAPVSSALSLNTMREIASLLDAMGAVPPAEDAQTNPVKQPDPTFTPAFMFTHVTFLLVLDSYGRNKSNTLPI